jgi:predicted nucleic acid-binding protein
MNANFLLDSDTCSAYLRGHGKVFNRVIQHGGAMALAAVTAGELWVVAVRRGMESDFARGLGKLLDEFAVLPFDLDCAKRFGGIRADLLSRGLDIGIPDAMIAAVALVHNLTLASGNVRHFVNIADLRLQNWLA